MTSKSNSAEIAKDKMQSGQMTADQANVYMVQLEGFRLITGKMHGSVRKALNEAVKRGELGHIKKEGLKPEAYHHINGRANALEAREAHFKAALESIKNIYA